MRGKKIDINAVEELFNLIEDLEKENNIEDEIVYNLIEDSNILSDDEERLPIRRYRNE